MTSPRRKYNTLSPFGGILSITIAELINAGLNLTRIKGVMDALTNGGLTTAALEGSAEFGIAVGSGQLFYDDVANMKAILAQIINLGSYDGG